MYLKYFLKICPSFMKINDNKENNLKKHTSHPLVFRESKVVQFYVM